MPRGQGERCHGFRSSDGNYAHCTREECANGLPLNSENGTYAHKFDGDCGCGVRHLVAAPRKEREKKTKFKILATYDYRDVSGNLLYQVVRLEPKDFRFRRPDGQGGWIWNMKGLRRVLYQLPLVLEAVKAGKTIYVVEGEKDADAIITAGGMATCNPGGAGKWRREYAGVLRGAVVIMITDKDQPGRIHASQVARSLRGIAASVQILEAKEGKDASDHLTAGLRLDDLVPCNGESIAAGQLGSNKGTPGGSEHGSGSQADALVRLVEEEGVELFTDPTGDSWARIPVKNTLQINRCRSKNFKHWMAGRYWNTQGKAPNSDSLSGALNVIEAKARYEGAEYVLHTRVAESGGAYWYDLADRGWRAVEVTATGWRIVAEPPILFRRYAHQRPQVVPTSGGDLRGLLEFVNLHEESQQLLLLVYVVACLVPDIPHPIPVLHGGQGCAKTTTLRVIRCLVDPSVTETLTMAHDPRDFVQQLAHHWMPLFDNVTTLSDWMSDALCRAATGDGFSKRELYTDDDDVIYSFRRCCGLNGINIAARNPDLLDRCILFGLEAIGKRKTEELFWTEFERARPALFGALLDVLSKAMSLRGSIEMEDLPRMADFAMWGCAIAEALGSRHQDFLAAFDKNCLIRNEEVLASSPVAAAVTSFMERRSAWEGSASELLAELVQVATGLRLDLKARTWPKAPHALTRRLNAVRHNLKAAGITVTTGGANRLLTIRKGPGNSVCTVNRVKSPEKTELTAVAPTDGFGDSGGIASREAEALKAAPGGLKNATDAPDAISGDSAPKSSEAELEVFEL